MDFAKKTKISHWYKYFLATLKWERKKLNEYRNERLRKLIQYAFTNSDYYRSVMQEKNISPEQINSIDDLERLPAIDRNIIIHENINLVSHAISFSRLHKGTSSGTTGIPIHYYYDNIGLSAGVAACYTLWSMSGWEFGQRNVHIWGNASSIQRWSKWSSKAKNALIGQLNIPSIWLNDPENIENVAKKIIKFDPISIEGYPSAIYTLAQHFQTKGYSLYSLKQVLTTAENLEGYQRELIEKIFAPTGDLYGSGEVLGVATRPIGDDKYYVFDPHVIIEVVDSGIPGMKDIIVTDLDNYGMPMIRYKIGDMIDDLYLPEREDKYPFTYFKKIFGRSSEIVQLPNGKRFHPVNIFGGTLFRKFPEITRHKVIWNGESLLFQFENQKPLNKDELESQIKELLAGYAVPFVIEFTNRILPSKNGKYAYFEKVSLVDRK